MREDEKKFFDVSKPREVGAHPTSRPLIVGHHPMMPDPMIREDKAKPQPPGPSLGDMPIRRETGPAFTPAVVPPPPAEIGAKAEAESPSPHLPTSPKPHGPTPPTSPGDSEELHLPAGRVAYHHKPRLWVWIILAIVILFGIYAAIDAKTDILPFHIFSHNKNSESTSNNNTTTSQPVSLNQSNLPAGFSHYQPVGTPVTFAYPTAWGTPTTTTDPGFSQRGKDKKTDGTHAYLVDFATNKDVEIAVTSSKYLPATRATLYYDYLGWCLGTNDSKIYKSILHFSTADGIDTPSTITCDQGPLTDATKVSDPVIVQLKTKDANGTVLGDVYTANLSDANLPVLRIKDAKMTNGTDIKKLLGTIAGTNQ